MKTKTNAGKQTKNRFLKPSDIGAWVLLLPIIIGLVLFTFYPQLKNIIYTFCDMEGYRITGFAGLDNYKRILSDTAFVKTLLNTCQYVFWSMLIGFGLPIVLAVLLNEMVHLRNSLRVLIYFPNILPGVATAMLWYYMYYPDASGLLNTIFGFFGAEPYVWLQDSTWTILFIVLSMTWKGAGGTSIYYFSALQGINRELYEAAIIDGAGFFTRIKTIVLPHIAGIALLFGVRQIIAVFSVMEQPLQMTGGGPNNASMTLSLMSYNYGFINVKPQLSATIGIIMFMLLFVFTIIYNKLDKKIEENQM